jgi:hypothetical protein
MLEVSADEVFGIRNAVHVTISMLGLIVVANLGSSKLTAGTDMQAD